MYLRAQYSVECCEKINSRLINYTLSIYVMIMQCYNISMKFEVYCVASLHGNKHTQFMMHLTGNIIPRACRLLGVYKPLIILINCQQSTYTLAWYWNETLLHCLMIMLVLYV